MIPYLGETEPTWTNPVPVIIATTTMCVLWIIASSWPGLFKAWRETSLKKLVENPPSLSAPPTNHSHALITSTCKRSVNLSCYLSRWIHTDKSLHLLDLLIGSHMSPEQRGTQKTVRGLAVSQRFKGCINSEWFLIGFIDRMCVRSIATATFVAWFCQEALIISKSERVDQWKKKWPYSPRMEKREGFRVKTTTWTARLT